MKILVCITNVPDTTSRIAFINNDTEFDKSGIQYVIGPYDDFALARAVELKEELGGTVTALNVGEAYGDPVIRKALAIGADDAIRINSFPKDSFFVAKQIAEVVKKGGYDLVLMGRESSDFNGGQVHGMVGEMVGLPVVSPVMKLDIENGKAKIAREIDGGKEFLEVNLPFIAGCQEPIAEWKIPNMRGIMSARTKPLQVLEPVGDETRISLKKFSLPPEKGEVKMIDEDNVEELVQLLKNEAKVI
ncbi:MAG: electron transfer flavoprotein subunit beta/FixA family protein [Bacteroidetes bacterium]|nr:electron transfer flavoprotein subunit beta/FixA family protein [Bacteroidota bacterium]MCZ6900042.1 electron transfer flavoprotein subunit beta/FixA family protein [Bacteroidota bacterium]